jgi:hypothetical protein
MSHADETLRLWHEIGWVDTVRERWEEFFSSLIDQPERAEALCALGLKVLSGEAVIRPQSGSTRWMAFFSSLAGKPTKAAVLCVLGLDLVRRNASLSDEATRVRVRSILRERWCNEPTTA